MNNLEVFYKKTVPYNYRKKNLLFKVSQSLFSSHDIDLGTKHLLQTLDSEGFNSYKKVLDLGCGYGPIGISLKSFYKPSIVHMVDRDALALDFSKQNAELNGLEGIKLYGSLGYDDISDRDFDLVISNIPAKVGEPVLSHILEDVRFYIKPEGRIAIVVIDAIGDYVTKVLESNKNINITFRKRWPGHLVFHYKFSSNIFNESKPKLGAFERGIYKRGQKDIYVNDLEVSINTSYGLPEFNILSYETEMLLAKIENLKGKQIKRALVFNPGQGFISSALSKICKVDEVNLVDRDLESLRVSRENMISNGYDSKKIFLFHETSFSKINPKSVDLVLGILDDKEDPKVHQMFTKELSEKLSNNELMILASGSTPIIRIESFVRKEKLFEVVERQKSKGKSIIVLKNRV
ncbi:MAG: methyltransferase [Candidatus Shapirobacteria bacterium]|nr:methyltransferase [Candidatus Shapirobacteria bacterium]